MELIDILSKEGVTPCAKVASKRQLLQLIADRAETLTGMSAHKIFETLMEREQLGSTGLGNGIAIPHGKLPGLNGVTALFTRLDQPLDFEAVDDRPVDLVVTLLAPTGAGADHLKALAKVARLMRTDSLVEALRHTRDQNKLFDLLTAAMPDREAV